MKNGKLMRWNKLCVWIAWCVLCLWTMEVSAQDVLPVKSRPDRHSGHVSDSKAMQQLLKFVQVSHAMPASFRETTENRIEDPTGELLPFWQKLSVLDRPLRIVHIGDSHVRGHVFPYVVRRQLEDDFGRDAVLDMQVSYRTSGLAQETGAAGIVYHILGVNGATYGSFSTPENIQQIIDLNPDFVILSFGTNEAHARRYSSAEHITHMDYLLGELKKGCPQAVYLLTTPPGAYVRNGRRGARVINPRTKLVVKTEQDYAASRKLALWDMYHIVGGERRACLNWSAGNYYQRDKIHFTQDGYILQGLLLHEAIIKSYNNYVETQLDGTRN